MYAHECEEIWMCIDTRMHVCVEMNTCTYVCTYVNIHIPHKRDLCSTQKGPIFILYYYFSTHKRPIFNTQKYSKQKRPACTNVHTHCVISMGPKYEHLYIYTYKHNYLYMYMHIYVHIYIYTYVYTYIY